MSWFDEEEVIDAYGQEVYPEIHWCVTYDGKEHAPWHFYGRFPFRTYLDLVQKANLDVICPKCENDLLTYQLNDYHAPYEQVVTFDTKRYCDHCGAKIMPPREDKPWRKDGAEIEEAADIDGWSLFFDEDNEEYHLLKDEQAARGVIEGWELILPDNVPAKGFVRL